MARLTCLGFGACAPTETNAARVSAAGRHACLMSSFMCFAPKRGQYSAEEEVVQAFRPAAMGYVDRLAGRGLVTAKATKLQPIMATAAPARSSAVPCVAS